MPLLSRFQGIIITMYSEPRAKHHRPHFHVRYGEYQAVYFLRPLSRGVGSVPTPQHASVTAWARLHMKELIKNWSRLQRGQNILPIDPLI
jgi:uncharacterized protein DUF4160